MPRRSPTARLYTEIDANSPSTESGMAQQSIAKLARISQWLDLVNLPELEHFMRENDLVLQVSYRCRCRNNRGWRCNNATNKRGTQCKSCGVSRRARERTQWAQRMVRDSKAKDDKPKRKPRNTVQTIISNSRYEDKRQGKISSGPNYIDVPHLEDLRTKQNTRCYWCDIEMDPVVRKQKCGMTVDRLDSGAHLKHHCVLACFSCNSKSYRYGWNPFPQYLSRIIGVSDLDEKNYFNPKKLSSQWPNRLTIHRWARMREELLRKRPRA